MARHALARYQLTARLLFRQLFSARATVQAPESTRFFAGSRRAEVAGLKQVPQNHQKPRVSPRWGVCFQFFRPFFQFGCEVLAACASSGPLGWVPHGGFEAPLIAGLVPWLALRSVVRLTNSDRGRIPVATDGLIPSELV
jgi:hypothetical protein